MMRKLKILNTIGKKYARPAKAILESCGEVDYAILSEREIRAKIADYDVLVIGLKPSIGREALSRAEKLKIIATATTGLDHIDEDYADSKGIKILSLKGETEFLNQVTGTAELAFGLMLDLMRNISASNDSVKHGRWSREEFIGHNLIDKTLGIVGFGRLWRMMAKFARGFSMKAIAFDPYVAGRVFKKLRVKRAGLSFLLKNSDIISLHLPLNHETENLFTSREFNQMKKSSYLINTSRGKVVNESDLLKSLKQKKIAGYATDVLTGEMDFNGNSRHHPLVEYSRVNKNLIITPHIGGATYESREATDILIAKKIREATRTMSSRPLGVKAGRG